MQIASVFVKECVSFSQGKIFVMDYEGYTFVFLSKYKQDFFIKM